MAEFQRGNRRALSMRDIRPQGWLARQLQIQMEGMTGKLYEGWDSVGSYSGWLGGTGETGREGPTIWTGFCRWRFTWEIRNIMKLPCVLWSGRWKVPWRTAISARSPAERITGPGL